MEWWPQCKKPIPQTTREWRVTHFLSPSGTAGKAGMPNKNKEKRSVSHRAWWRQQEKEGSLTHAWGQPWLLQKKRTRHILQGWQDTKTSGNGGKGHLQPVIDAKIEQSDAKKLQKIKRQTIRTDKESKNWYEYGTGRERRSYAFAGVSRLVLFLNAALCTRPAHLAATEAVSTLKTWRGCLFTKKLVSSLRLSLH